MAVRLIPCRHTETGAETEIAETALGYFPDYEPIGDHQPDAEASGDGQPQAKPDGEQTPRTDEPARKSKPATGAAKNTPKE